MKKAIILGLFVMMVQFVHAQTTASSQAGYTGTKSFRDETDDIAGIKIRSGWWIDGISIISKKSSRTFRGGSGGTAYNFMLRSGEKITGISGTYGKQYGNYIMTLQFHTNQRSSQVYGTKRGTGDFNFQVPSGYKFAGLAGKYGQHLNAIGILYKRAQTVVNVKPKLYTPAANAVLDNGCSTNTNDPLYWDFSWYNVPGATEYNLYVKNDNSANPFINTTTQARRYTHNKRGSYIASHLRTGWKWWIRAKVNGVWGEWSNARSFSVESLNKDCSDGNGGSVTPRAPRLSSPVINAQLDNSCSSGTNPMDWKFSWASVSGASQYEIYVKNRNSARPLFNTTTSSTSYNYSGRSGSYIANHLLNGWTWKVRAKVNGSWSAWSTMRSFSVEKVNTDCAPIRIKMKNEGAFISKFKVTYYVNGTRKEWNSPSAAVTWGKTIELPANAKNIMVSAKTMGIGGTQIFRVQALGSNCFKVYGTMFSPQMNSKGCN